MVRIQQLAPTLIDALQAVEQGCRRVQDDRHFYPVMVEWLKLGGQDHCIGCLATSTFMQLSNKTGKDILNRFSDAVLAYPYEPNNRPSIFDIEEGRSKEGLTEFHYFEAAVDSLRHNELFPLLKFYGLDQHTNAEQAIVWYRKNNTWPLDCYTTRKQLLPYADFIKNQLIPKIQELIN
jgi:hypothetical protein